MRKDEVKEKIDLVGRLISEIDEECEKYAAELLSNENLMVISKAFGSEFRTAYEKTVGTWDYVRRAEAWERLCRADCVLEAAKAYLN